MAMAHRSTDPSDETLAAIQAAYGEALARHGSRQEALESLRRHNAEWAAHLESVEALLGLVAEAHRPDDLPAPPAAALPPTGPHPPGYEILGVLGKGGMGVVYKARQVALNRVVALKMIRGYMGKSEVARFRSEAEALARLQHPNIVHVYDIGLHDGEQFFSLEYVEGGSLDKKLQGKPQPAQQCAEVVGVLARAIHAAHEKKIIHRDLKPANVLVTGDGVLKVSDFGLAKQVDADGGQTRTGQVMGTPSYMAPEQAAGRGEAVGPAADVYALGAVLYECLTGRPPFNAATPVETLKQVQDSEPVSPRQLNVGVPRDLETICLKCLEKEPEKRYASAEELADDLRRFTDGLPIRARPASRLERVWKWSRRHKAVAALVVAFGMIALLIVVGAVLGVVWNKQANEKQQAADRAVSQGMGEAGLLMEQARANPVAEVDKFRQAEERMQQAEELATTAGASEGMRREVAARSREYRGEALAGRRDRQLLAALQEVPAPHERPVYAADEREFQFGTPEPEPDEQFAAAFRAWDPSFDVDLLSTEDAAARLRARPAAVVTEVVAALEAWASARQVREMPAPRSQRIWELAERLDGGDPVRHELRAIMAKDNLPKERAIGALAVALRPVPVPFDAGLGKDRARLRELTRQIDAATAPVLAVTTLAQALWRAGDEEGAQQLCERAVRARPQEVLFQRGLGTIYEHRQVPSLDRAIECYAAARSLRPELGIHLADILVKSGRAEAGISLFDYLAKVQPENPWVFQLWGEALHDLHKYTDAELKIRRVLALNPRSYLAHLKLGNILEAKGEADEARQEYEATITLRPGQKVLAAARVNLGNIWVQRKQPLDAIAEYDAAIRLEPNLAEAHYNRANVLKGLERLRDADIGYRSAIAIRPDYAKAIFNLGNLLAQSGQFGLAVRVLREAVRLQPDNLDFRTNLAAALTRLGDLDTAAAELQIVVRLNPELFAARVNLGHALFNLDRYDKALIEYSTAVRLNPRDPTAQYQRALCYYQLKMYSDALRACATAIDLQPNYPDAYGLKANVYRELHDPPSALRELEQAVKLRNYFPWAHHYLGCVLHEQGEYVKAEASYRTAIRQLPGPPQFHDRLGVLLTEQGRFTEAEAVFRSGLATASDSASWRGAFDARLQACRHSLALDARLPAFLHEDGERLTADEYLDLATFCQLPCKRCYATAARLSAAALRADPSLGNDLERQSRYSAARAACRAAAGEGEDAKLLPDKVAVMLRHQALRWLHEDLLLYASLTRSRLPSIDAAVLERLSQWQRDPGLASVRDLAAVSRLSDTERGEWRLIWHDVSLLLQSAAVREKAMRQGEGAAGPAK